MDEDGDPDLCVTGYNGTDRIYRNDFEGNNWLQVELEGIADNAYGFGALVSVHTGSHFQVRVVGAGNGYLSQNDLTLIFGLGVFSDVDSLIVEWPNGELAIYDVRGRRIMILLDEVRPSVRHEIHWDGRNGEGRLMASGVYYVRLRSGGKTDTRPILLLR